MKEPAQIPGVAALVLRAGVKSDDVRLVTGWFVKLMMCSAEYAGFLSAEIIPPISKSEGQWTLVEWFRSEEQLKCWQSAPEREALKQEVLASCSVDSLTLSEEVTNQVGSRGSVATAIVTQVKPGMEKSYREWESKIKLAQSQFPGYRGAYYQPPMDDVVGPSTTLLRFDTPENLDKWFASEERAKLLDEVGQFVKSTDYRKIISSFPGWFPANEKSGSNPSRWKTSMLVLLCLYPLTVLQLHYVRPMLTFLPSEVITFISNLTSIIIISWLLMPFALKRFDAWLYPDKPTKSVDLKGMAVIVALYLVEVILLLRLVG